MTSTSFRLTLVACSAPEGWDKRRLLPPRWRARRMRRVIGRIACRQARRAGEPKRHVVAGLFESGTWMDRAAARAGWAFQLSDPPNNRLRNGTVRGNGALWLNVPGLQLEHTLHVDVGHRLLHLPVYQSPRLGLRVFVAHRETRRADPYGAGRRKVAQTLEAAVVRSLQLGWHVVVLVDWNGTPPEIAGMKVAVREGVDSILVSRRIDVGATNVVKARRVTDHPGILTASVRIPLTSGP